jgi:AcrR family transcriptional regulator
MKKVAGEGRYHHGDLRRAILDAALELIAEAGMANLSLREVARKIGVTTGAPYHHFKDRGALLLEIAKQGFEQLLQRLRAARESSEREELQAEAREYLQFAWENAARYSVMFSAEMAEQPYCAELKPIADQSFALVCASVARARQLGERASAEAALCVWAMLHGLAVLDQSGLLQEERREQERIGVEGVTAVLRGMGGTGAREPR